jgi:hypothetical protein
VLVEPGIALNKLNELLDGQEVVLNFPDGDDSSVEEVIQMNKLCLASLKDGFYNSRGSVERLGLITGAGDLIQTGGNASADRSSAYGFGFTGLIEGSRAQLGLLYEVLLNTRKTEESNHGIMVKLPLKSDSTTMKTVLESWMVYYQETSPSERVDALILMGDT